ncbi:MAG: DNA gyrase inhibitor YacG [Polyangiaceae bacterium]
MLDSSQTCYVAGVRIECPTCRRVIEDAPEDHAARPFCSQRCKLVDLDNWLNERYRFSRPLTPADVDSDDQLS